MEARREVVLASPISSSSSSILERAASRAFLALSLSSTMVDTAPNSTSVDEVVIVSFLVVLNLHTFAIRGLEELLNRFFPIDYGLVIGAYKSMKKYEGIVSFALNEGTYIV